MIRPTKIGMLTLGMALALYLAALTSQSGLLLLFIGIFLGCFLVNGITAKRRIDDIEIHPPPSVQLEEGRTMTEAWRLKNRSSRANGYLVGASPAGPLFRVAQLKAGESVNVVPSLVFPARGVYTYAQFHLISMYPFGLLQAKRPMSVPGEVVVYPALYPTAAPPAAGYDLMLGGKFHGNRRSNSGASFAGIRPIQNSDPLKQIHWKSSSKGLGLMVKVYDEERAGRIACITDAGHTGDRSRLDACARATGSLLFAALDDGHHIEWIDLGNLEPLMVPPFSDGHELLEALARLESAPGCLTAQRLESALELVSRKSAICLVLTQWTEEVAALVAHLRHHHRVVSVYLPHDAALTEEPPPAVLGYYRDNQIEIAA